MRVGGRKVFCLNPGKSLHNQDRAKGKKVSAVNYKDQALAKVLTYYFGTNGQKGGTKTYALCQAYAWAAGKGKNKRTAMLDCGSIVKEIRSAKIWEPGSSCRIWALYLST